MITKKNHFRGNYPFYSMELNVYLSKNLHDRFNRQSYS